MTCIRILASVICIFLFQPSLHAADRPQVHTEQGTIAGKLSRDKVVRDYLGIPYAAPPVGNLRWKAPQAVAPWHGVLQATSFGKRCIQSGTYPDILFRDSGESEDCLTLNVWTAAKSSRAKLPVMVWFYGGGFNMGGTSEARQDGENLARKGVVVVSMNYRLGIFGFYANHELSAESPHQADGNYGLLDQVAALRWVQQNIVSFGGDPANVTIFGQSAGSSAVSAHMASPLSHGLFAHAIGESGGVFKRREVAYPLIEKAEKQDEAFAQAAFGTSSIAKLRALPAEVLLKAALRKAPEVPRFQPTIDGYFFPQPLTAIYAPHQQNDVPLLAGWTRDEGTNQVVNLPQKLTVAGLKATARADFGPDANEFLKVYAASNDHESVRVAEDYASDKFIAYATWVWLEMQTSTGHAPVYRYYFDLGSPGDPLHPAANGAFHADDIEYVFGNLDSRKGAVWRPEDYRLSKLMQSYWTNFAKTGNPNAPGLPEWPTYNERARWQVLHLGATPKVQPDRHRSRFLFLQRLWGEPSVSKRSTAGK